MPSTERSFPLPMPSARFSHFLLLFVLSSRATEHCFAEQSALLGTSVICVDAVNINGELSYLACFFFSQNHPGGSARKHIKGTDRGVARCFRGHAPLGLPADLGRKLQSTIFGVPCSIVGFSEIGRCVKQLSIFHTHYPSSFGFSRQGSPQRIFYLRLSYFCIFLRHCNHCQVLFHHIHTPPLGLFQFPISW